jgi:hypothetical protein
MTHPSRLNSYLWITAPLLALVFLFWLTAARLHRIDHVTNLVETEAMVDPASPTGYAGGLRKLIVPEHNNDSYQWIVQTQQMLARGEWRVRHINYDNAPAGRTVLTPSPFRWWLGLVAVVDHWVSGRPTGQSVEYAARYAGPCLQLLLLAGAVAFAAWRFGTLAAGLLAVAMATLFPFGGAFLAGQPDDTGLLLACTLANLLLLLAGVMPRQDDAGPPRPAAAAPWFLAAGVAGGLGLWVDTPQTIPVLAGIVLGAGFIAWNGRRAIKRGQTGPEPLPWRQWALAGALTCLVAHLVEYLPDYWGGMPGRHVHPVYGVAWLGAGELLARFSAWCHHGGSPGRRRAWLPTGLATLALAVVPVVLLLPGNRDFFTADLAGGRLSDLPGSPVGLNLWSWMSADGSSLALWATCLPLLLVLPAAWLLLRRNAGSPVRAMDALVLGPLLVALGFAWVHLRWWNSFDAVWLALLVVLAVAARPAAGFPGGRWTLLALSLVLLAPGAVLLGTKAASSRHDAVTEGEVVALVERDLAHWLARQAGAVVLAPPNLATSLYFHGGLAVIGTPYWENREGFIASVKIAAATSPDEAQVAARARQLNYIVIPSWDNFLDEYARLGSEKPDQTLVALLHRWLAPRWLRPVPYQLPQVSGFEGQSAAIFEVVDVQDNATALSHLAEYFAEMGQTEQARAVAYSLERSFPADLGAGAARVLATQAAGDRAAASRALSDVEAALSRGDDQTLAWERRVSLAIALVEGKRFEQAREQARRCLADIDGPRLRSLTTVSLHRLLVMSRGFGLEIGDPQLRTLAQQLLPPEMRNRP